MTFRSLPPLITSQMPWWEAVMLIGLLPVSIFLFRWFLVGPGAQFFQNRFTLRIGLIVCVTILGSGFVSTGYALIDLLNYTRVESDGVRIVKFLQADKFQRWLDLVAVDEMERKAWEWGKNDKPYHQSTGYRLAADQRRFMPWLRKHSNVLLKRTGHEWQKQAYDHVLRPEESDRDAFQSLAHYIKENPVRAGLVPQARAWKHLGGVVPGYPELAFWGEDYWPRYWRIVASRAGK